MKHTVEELVAIQRGQLRAAEEYIRQFYATVPNDVLAATLDMSVDMVQYRARKMGLRKERLPKDANGCTLTPAAARAERRRIRREYPDADREGLQRLARDLGITLDQLKARAKRYGVSRKEERIREDQSNSKSRKYDAAFIERLRDYYPTHTNRECADHFDMPLYCVNYLATKHGIYKTQECIQRAQMEGIRRAREKKQNRKTIIQEQ